MSWSVAPRSGRNNLTRSIALDDGASFFDSFSDSQDKQSNVQAPGCSEQKPLDSPLTSHPIKATSVSSKSIQSFNPLSKSVTLDDGANFFDSFQETTERTHSSQANVSNHGSAAIHAPTAIQSTMPNTSFGTSNISASALMANNVPSSSNSVRHSIAVAPSAVPASWRTPTAPISNGWPPSTTPSLATSMGQNASQLQQPQSLQQMPAAYPAHSTYASIAPEQGPPPQGIKSLKSQGSQVQSLTPPLFVPASFQVPSVIPPAPPSQNSTSAFGPLSVPASFQTSNTGPPSATPLAAPNSVKSSQSMVYGNPPLMQTNSAQFTNPPYRSPSFPTNLSQHTFMVPAQAVSSNTAAVSMPPAPTSGGAGSAYFTQPQVAPAVSFNTFTPVSQLAPASFQRPSYWQAPSVGYGGAVSGTTAGSHSGSRSPDGRPPGPLLNFGFGGRTVLMKPARLGGDFAGTATPTYLIGLIHMVSLTSLNTATCASLPSTASELQASKAHNTALTTASAAHPLKKLLESFPGPLRPGTAKDKLMSFLADRSSRSAEEIGIPGLMADLSATMWELLWVMVKYGAVPRGGTKGAGIKDNGILDTELVKALRGNASSKSAPKSTGSVGSVVDTPTQDLPGSWPRHLPVLAGESCSDQMTAAEKVQVALVESGSKEALKLATECGLWDVALLLASLLGEKAYGETVAAMASTRLVTGSPLRSLALAVGQRLDLLHDAKAPGSKDMGANPNGAVGVGGGAWGAPADPPLLTAWRDNLAVLLGQRGQAAVDSIITLGDRLRQESAQVLAAHVCYIVAGAPPAFIDATGATARYLLLGSDQASTPRCYADLLCMQRTQVLEYVRLSAGDNPAAFLSLAPYKLLHAQLLAEHGLVGDALSYCSAVEAMLKTGGTKLPASFSLLASQTEALKEQLLGFAQHHNVSTAKTGESSITKLGRWLDSGISKFLWGDEAGENPQASGGSNNPSPPATAAPSYGVPTPGNTPMTSGPSSVTGVPPVPMTSSFADPSAFMNSSGHNNYLYSGANGWGMPAAAMGNGGPMYPGSGGGYSRGAAAEASQQLPPSPRSVPGGTGFVVPHFDSDASAPAHKRSMSTSDMLQGPSHSHGTEGGHHQHQAGSRGATVGGAPPSYLRDEAQSSSSIGQPLNSWAEGTSSAEKDGEGDVAKDKSSPESKSKDTKKARSGGGSPAEKSGSWWSFFRRKGKNECSMGDENKFYYNKELGRWVIKGEEHLVTEEKLAPPPTAFSFQTSIGSNSGMAPISSPDTPGSSNPSTPTPSSPAPPAPSTSPLGGPPLPTASSSPILSSPPVASNLLQRQKQGVRSRYVDVFNSQAGSSQAAAPQLSSLLPSAAPLMPPAGPPSNFFIPPPAPIQSSDSVKEVDGKTEGEQSSSTGDQVSEVRRTPTGGPVSPVYGVTHGEEGGPGSQRPSSKEPVGIQSGAEQKATTGNLQPPVVAHSPPSFSYNFNATQTQYAVSNTGGDRSPSAQVSPQKDNLEAARKSYQQFQPSLYASASYGSTAGPMYGSSRNQSSDRLATEPAQSQQDGLNPLRKSYPAFQTSGYTQGAFTPALGGDPQSQTDGSSTVRKSYQSFQPSGYSQGSYSMGSQGDGQSQLDAVDPHRKSYQDFQPSGYTQGGYITGSGADPQKQAEGYSGVDPYRKSYQGFQPSGYSQGGYNTSDGGADFFSQANYGTLKYSDGVADSQQTTGAGMSSQHGSRADDLGGLGGGMDEYKEIEL